MLRGVTAVTLNPNSAGCGKSYKIVRCVGNNTMQIVNVIKNLDRKTQKCDVKRQTQNITKSK